MHELHELQKLQELHELQQLPKLLVVAPVVATGGWEGSQLGLPAELPARQGEDGEALCPGSRRGRGPQLQ